MILSDRSIREELAAGRIVIEPFDETCVQPSSVDLHVDGQFRVFRNNRYPFIDVMSEQPDLTELVETTDGEPFILTRGDGYLTLELSNVANLPITIYPSMKIGQISFFRLSTPADVPNSSSSTKSRYQGQRGPTASRFFEEFSGKREA